MMSRWHKIAAIASALLASAYIARADMMDGVATIGRVLSVNGLTGTVITGNATPGGRLTISSGVCAPTTDITAATTLWYAPCVNPYVPIYNGANVQAYNFTSSATDSVGLALVLGSNWAGGILFDTFATVSSGVPVLCTVAWSGSGFGTSSRATVLSPYAGILTNSTLATCRTSNTATIQLGINQGTYLGTFATNNPGQIDFKFGSAASGGGYGTAAICNQYNQVTGAFLVTDTAASWSVTATSTFQAFDAGGSGSGTLNRVYLVSCNGSGPVQVAMTGTHNESGVGQGAYITAALNVTNAVWSKCATATNSVFAGNHTITTSCNGYAPAGFNFIQAIQFDTSGTGSFVSGSSPPVSGLSVTWSW